MEIIGKSLELLREMAPTAPRVARLTSPAVRESRFGAALREAAQRMKISIIGPPLDPPFEEAGYRRVFEANAGSVDALVVDNLAENFTNRRLIVGFAERTRIPTIYALRAYAEVGGLMAYEDPTAAVRREIWAHQISFMSRPARDTIEIPRSIWQRMQNALAYAA